MTDNAQQADATPIDTLALARLIAPLAHEVARLRSEQTELIALLQILSVRPSVDAPEERSRFLSVNQVAKEYGLGRRQVIELIEAGKLPATERKGRGGYMAYSIAREHAERSLVAEFSTVSTMSQPPPTLQAAQ